MLTSTFLPSNLLAQPGMNSGTEAAAPMVPVTPTDDPEVHYSLGNAGRCSGHKRLYAFAFDDSGSVTGVGGNDPLSKRYAEARLAIRTLARACRCGRELAAVCHWDVSRLDVPPVGFDQRGTALLQHGMRLPVDGGGTSDLGPVLGRITRLTRVWAWRGWDVHLIVLSDFELTDTDSDGVFAQLDRFARPHNATAVVLGGNPPTQLLDSHATVLPVISSDPPGALAMTLFDVLTRDRIGRRP
jgi:hypothetical protein